MELLRKRVGRNIKMLRLKAGFKTQGDLAAAVGVKQSTIQRWESGAFLPFGDHLDELERALKVDRKQILTDDVWVDAGVDWQGIFKSMKPGRESMATIATTIHGQTKQKAKLTEKIDELEERLRAIEDEREPVAQKEKELLDLFRGADPEQRSAILDQARRLSGHDRKVRSKKRRS